MQMCARGKAMLIISSVFICCIFWVKSFSANPVLSREELSTSGFTVSHSPTIVEAQNGDLVVSFYAGGEEGEDAWIYVDRKPQGGDWTGPVKIDNRIPGYNPVLFRPKGKRIILLWYRFHISAYHCMKYSLDDGRTWIPESLDDRISLPSADLKYFQDAELEPQYHVPNKNKPLELDDGTLLIGASSEFNGWVSFVETVTPENNYTTNYEVLAPDAAGGIQPIFFRLTPDAQKILMTTRDARRAPSRITTGDGYLSTDYGKTWEPQDLNGNYPGWPGDGVTLDNGWHVAVWGRPENEYAVSSDGFNWERVLTINDGGEYPSIIQTSDRKLHVVTGSRGTGGVTHFVLDPDLLTGDATAISDRTGTGMQRPFDIVVQDGTAKIVGNSGGPVTIELYSSSGRKVAQYKYSGVNDAAAINLKSLVSGRGAFYLKASGAACETAGSFVCIQ
ncbi:MAG: hypothetical protein GF350_17135 [Chitinivibrionales bacterium]|nr:hypothetical protein [Chitinivibrionales bacterium]